MRHKLLFLTLLSVIFLAGCRKDDESKLKIDPETLFVEQKGGICVVTTSGFDGCDIIFDLDDNNSERGYIEWGYNNSYECDWFTVVISDDWRKLNFEFKENTSPKQRSVIFQLGEGPIFNRFTVIQEGTE